jgi:type I restriction enzyme S subunit
MTNNSNPQEWKECKLGDLLGVKGYIRGPFGSALRRNELHSEGIPVYEQQHAIYNHRKFRFFIDEKKHQVLKRFTVNTNDLIISCSGTLGKVSIISDKDPMGIISQALLLFRPDIEKVLPKYLYYFLASPVGFNSILSVSSGSVQVNIAKRNIVENIDFLLPPLPEQHAIVGVLSSLDDKIDLLHRQNKTLEGMAEALWRKMFVEEADPGWKKGKLGDIADNIRESISVEKLQSYEHYVGLEHIEKSILHYTIGVMRQRSRAISRYLRKKIFSSENCVPISIRFVLPQLMAFVQLTYL